MNEDRVCLHCGSNNTERVNYEADPHGLTMQVFFECQDCEKEYTAVYECEYSHKEERK